MFSGFKGRDSEGDVQVIGDHDIDNLDVFSCQYFEMICRDPAFRMIFSSLPGRVLRLACDGNEFVIRQGFDRRRVDAAPCAIAY
jgi:hypothetical protein